MDRRIVFGVSGLLILAASAAMAQSDGMGGGTAYVPNNGTTTFVGDGMGGGTAYGPNGTTTFVSDGMGGGTAYGPN
jgi:hypothetical protein